MSYLSLLSFKSRLGRVNGLWNQRLTEVRFFHRVRPRGTVSHEKGDACYSRWTCFTIRVIGVIFCSFVWKRHKAPTIWLGTVIDSGIPVILEPRTPNSWLLELEILNVSRFHLDLQLIQTICHDEKLQIVERLFLSKRSLRISTFDCTFPSPANHPLSIFISVIYERAESKGYWRTCIRGCKILSSNST